MLGFGGFAITDRSQCPSRENTMERNGGFNRCTCADGEMIHKESDSCFTLAVSQVLSRPNRFPVLGLIGVSGH